MIVAVMTRSAVVIVRREVAKVIRRLPAGIAVIVAMIAVEQRRTANKYRLNDVVSAIDIRITDHLYVRRSVEARAAFDYESGHILEDVLCQHSLNHIKVVVAVHCLHHAKIIHIAIPVQVEVGNHVLIRVEDRLKLFYGIRLSKSCSYGLKIQIKTDIGSNRTYLNGRCSSLTLRRNANGCGRISRGAHICLRCVARSHVTDRSVGICHRYDTSETRSAAHGSCSNRQHESNLAHIGKNF